jgi:hypothetical protein
LRLGVVIVARAASVMGARVECTAVIVREGGDPVSHNRLGRPDAPPSRSMTIDKHTNTSRDAFRARAIC